MIVIIEYQYKSLVYKDISNSRVITKTIVQVQRASFMLWIIINQSNEKITSGNFMKY